jgi:hypothetical protein
MPTEYSVWMRRLSSALAFAQPELVRRAQRPSIRQRLDGARAFGFVSACHLSNCARWSVHDLVPALVEDAAARASGLNPKQVYPISFDRTAKALTVATAAFVVFSLMPNIDWMRSPEQRALAGVLNRQGKELEAVAKKCARKKNRRTGRSQAHGEEARSAGQADAARSHEQERSAAFDGPTASGTGKAADSKQQNSGGIGNLEQIEQQLQNESMQSMEGQQMQRELEKKQYEKAAEQLENWPRRSKAAI